MRNLLDFLQRCAAHRIYVNLFCGLASPLDFREQQLREFISVTHLDANPVVMAYDTIWEPGNYVFRHDWRPRWDQDWNAWLIEQYGSVSAAEADWEFPCPRDKDGNPTSPPTRFFRQDGPWRALMAAYRRFMDDLMSRKWNQAQRRLLAIDPHHLIGFRQGNTLPHDFTFTATAKHIDFISPEGYAIEQSEQGYYAAGFITRYVHFLSRGKPVLWAEFGKSIWDGQRMEPSRDAARDTAEYHDMFYRMVLESGANGTAPWWWPGGYRVGERSDYGIMNPDGTERPAANLIRHYAPQLKAQRTWPPATSWLTLDRDQHAGGYWHACFNTGRDAYRDAVRQGGQLGIRTAGTGTDSANTPLLAVGNKRCNGHNPAKYLNAEFNYVQIRDVTGQWVNVNEGDTVTVGRNGPILARVNLGNTQEATWLAAERGNLQTGDVLLATTAASQRQGQWPLAESTPYLADAAFDDLELARDVTQRTRIQLRMVAHQRCSFGEIRSFTLQPR